MLPFIMRLPVFPIRKIILDLSAETKLASQPERIDYLDGWRGMAIALVLVDHFFYLPGVDSGRFGVDVFFVLSGMLMSNILFVKRSSLGIFYKRRISRIIPTFLLYIIVICFTRYLSSNNFDYKSILSTVLFMRTYFPVSPDMWSDSLPIGHLWSLNIEEHSYIIMSLLTLIIIINKKEWVILIPLGLISILFYIAYYHFPSIAPHSFEIRTESQMAFIMLSAGYFLVRDKFKPFIRPWMIPAALAGASLCYFNGEGLWSYVLAPALLVFTIVHLGQASPKLLQLLATKPLRMLGKWSYSLYLWQQPFYKAIGGHYFAVGHFIMAIAVGVTSYYCFEEPVREWLNSRWN
jgi:peptidoglycan/LPS O-acetylase OafA/YrhL